MNKDAAETERPALSIIIPTLNEAQSITATLEALTSVRGILEVIVVDGGSGDLTTQIAHEHGAQVIMSERGRGLQMHSGACVAQGEVLLFLHADSTAPPAAAELIAEALAYDAAAIGGNFAVRFDGVSSAARFLTWLYPKLEKLGLSYGDSGIFVRASVYRQVGGFKSFPIFEDLDFLRRLKRRGRIVHLPAAVVTSSRRFEGRSFALTFARWSILQGLYWVGVHPRTLDHLYAPVRGKG
ncbi:MAG: TIGR04283 family arsenosugar biosynthesis glycosyltransferase [Pyrinomonadaceae bacterium]